MNSRMRKGLVMTCAMLTGACLAVVIYTCVRADEDNSVRVRSEAGEEDTRRIGPFLDRLYPDRDVMDYEQTDYTVDVLGAPYDYREKLDDMLEREPATEEFVRLYPTMYGTADYSPLNTTVDEHTGGVPLLMQWDTRWGFMVYGSNAMGFTGCGPTCLSMVASYLLSDPDLTPGYMAQYSIDNGYCITGSGTSWSLMSDGAAGLGLDVTEIPVDEERIISNLEVGNPIIMIMGPGEFTTEGHFVVLCGYENGIYKINDPYSVERSERGWTFEEFSDQILDLWVYRVL